MAEILTLKQRNDMDMDSLKQMFEMHIKECDKRDERNIKTNDRIETLFKGIWDAHDEMKQTVTNLQMRIAMGIGALIVIGKGIDYYFLTIHK